MKQRLLSFFAMTAVALTTMAQTTWTPPPFDASKGIEPKSSATDTVYLYNVGAAQFLVGGTTWGTHAALGTNGLPLRLTADSQNAWTIYFWEGSKSQKILGRSTVEDLYIDYNNQATWCTTFTFTKVGNYYRFQSNVNDATYGQEAMPGTYIGQVPTREDFDKDGNSLGFGVGVFGNVTESEPDAHIDWAIISKADYMDYYAVISIKEQLLSLINTAEDEGTDVTKFVEVLEDKTATVEQVKKAIAELKAALIAVIGEGASEDKPVDVTSLFIINPDFNGMSTTGWTLTGGYGKTQNNKNHPIETGEGVGEEGLDTGGWLEFWNSGGINKDQDAHQVINDLPAGSYRLGLVGVGQGGKLYAITNGIRQEKEIPSQQVQRLSFDFVHIGGDLTFGFDFKPAAGNTIAWVAVDKFRLNYLGMGESPTIIILRNALENLTPYTDEEDDYIVSAALYQEIKALDEKANGLIDSNSSDEELNTSVIEEINAMVSRAAADAAAYKRLDAFAKTTLPNAIQQYQKLADRSTAYNNLYTKMKDEWKELVEEVLDERTWSIAQIDDFLAQYETEISEARNAYQQEVRDMFNAAAAKVANGGKLDAPIDITVLFAPLTFPDAKTLAKNLEDKYGWNFQATENFNSNDGLKFEHHTAEGWSCVFDANTVIKDLPMGKYSIKVNAFYRPTTNEETLAIYEDAGRPDLAWFYLSNGNYEDEAAILNWDRLLDLYPTTVDDEGNEKDNRPNSQEAAHACFTGTDGSGASAFTALTLSTVLRDSGNLTIGAKTSTAGDGLGSNSWVIWSDITLFYEGAITTSDLDDEIQGLIDLITVMQESNEAKDFTNKAKDLLAEAKNAGTAALKDSDTEKKNTAIEQMNAAIEYAAASVKLVAELTDVQLLYSSKLYDLRSLGNYYENEEAYNTLLETAFQVLEPNGVLKDNETLQGYLDGIKDGWYPLILSRSDMIDAAEDNPVDLSEIILNSTFDDMIDATTSKPKDWNVTYETNGGKGREGIAEFWNSSTFDINQDIPMLCEGYWRLSVNALFRAGNPDDELNALSAGTGLLNKEYLYLVIGGNERTQKVMQWSDLQNGAIIKLDEVPAAQKGEEGYEAYAAYLENTELLSYLTGQKDYNYTAEGVTVNFVAPNDQASLVSFIDPEHANRYKNEIVFSYKQDDGPVRIGLKLLETVANNWSPFDNFRLEYLGTTAPTAIENIAAQGYRMDTAATVIYSIDGRQHAQLRRGLNIVRTTDGQVRKVLVK